jgi:hypothetical protein
MATPCLPERRVIKAQITALELRMTQLPMDHLKQPHGLECWRSMLKELAGLVERRESR